MKRGFLNNNNSNDDDDENTTEQQQQQQQGRYSEYGPLQDFRSLPLVTRMRILEQKKKENIGLWKTRSSSSFSSSSSSLSSKPNRLGTASNQWTLPLSSATRLSLSSSSSEPGKGFSVRSSFDAHSVSDTTLSTTNSTTTTAESRSTSAWGNQRAPVDQIAALNFREPPRQQVRHDEESKSVAAATTTTTTTVSSSLSSSSSSSNNNNKYANCLLHPFKTVHVPKAALHALYGKDPFRKVLAATENYFTWHNAGPPHARQWTSLFLCPIKGEVFLSAPYGTDQDKSNEPPTTKQAADEWVWFSKKTHAEHGAAARAYDCLILRQALHNHHQHVRLSCAEPYLEIHARYDLPDSVPASVRQKILAQQELFQRIDRAMCNNDNDDSNNNNNNITMDDDDDEDVSNEHAWMSGSVPSMEQDVMAMNEECQTEIVDE